MIYHKALSIIENFFPDGEEVSFTRGCKTFSWVIIMHPVVLKYLLVHHNASIGTKNLSSQCDEVIAPKAGEANFEFSAAENAVPGNGFQF